MIDCIFCKIKNGEIPAKLVYQDEDVMVFPDIHPAAKIHLLIVPKQHIPEFLFVEDEALRNSLFHVVQKMIQESGLKDNFYQIRINGGGLQEVNHLHIHLMGPFGPGAR